MSILHLLVDIPFMHHSHAIGKGGEQINKLMESTRTSIHFPDNNKLDGGFVTKSNIVSISGSLDDVNNARETLRCFLPITIVMSIHHNTLIEDENLMEILLKQIKEFIKIQFSLNILFDGTSSNEGNRNEIEKSLNQITMMIKPKTVKSNHNSDDDTNGDNKIYYLTIRSLVLHIQLTRQICQIIHSIFTLNNPDKESMSLQLEFHRWLKSQVYKPIMKERLQPIINFLHEKKMNYLRRFLKIYTEISQTTFKSCDIISVLEYIQFLSNGATISIYDNSHNANNIGKNELLVETSNDEPSKKNNVEELRKNHNAHLVAETIRTHSCHKIPYWNNLQNFGTLHVCIQGNVDQIISSRLKLDDFLCIQFQYFHLININLVNCDYHSISQYVLSNLVNHLPVGILPPQFTVELNNSRWCLWIKTIEANTEIMVEFCRSFALQMDYHCSHMYYSSFIYTPVIASHQSNGFYDIDPNNCVQYQQFNNQEISQKNKQNPPALEENVEEQENKEMFPSRKSVQVNEDKSEKSEDMEKYYTVDKFKKRFSLHSSNRDPEISNLSRSSTARPKQISDNFRVSKEIKKMLNDRNQENLLSSSNDRKRQPSENDHMFKFSSSIPSYLLTSKLSMKKNFNQTFNREKFLFQSSMSPLLQNDRHPKKKETNLHKSLSSLSRNHSNSRKWNGLRDLHSSTRHVKPWTVQQILERLTLMKYSALFKKHEIDFELFKQLTVEDLKEMGIDKLGHRRLLADEIEILKKEQQLQMN
ncbi:hypothetical protein SNEBB_002904 [Seison nebaliae]|nr:hypothetical protein SNEBB_002904 [Seison nebaliae]